MKNTYKLIISALAMLSLVSCLKDYEPTAYLTEAKKKDIAQGEPEKVFAATLAGIYTNLQQYSNGEHYNYGQKSFDWLTSHMGNDLVMDKTLNNYGLYHYMIDYWQQEWAPCAMRWAEYYNHISAANSVISSIEEETASNSALNFYAQALATRGYAYFQLASLYQRSYYVGSDDTKWGKGTKYDWSEAPCVPLLTEKTSGDQPRASVKDIYAQITGDLTKAIEIFKKTGCTRTASPTDFDGCVAAIYLARTYLNMQEWDKALACAQIVIDNFGYLTEEKDILQGFSDLNLPDVVFGCDINSDNTTVYMSYFSNTDIFGAGYGALWGGKSGFKPFVDRMGDNDVRLEWFLCDRSESNILYAAHKTEDYQSCKFIGVGRYNLKQNEDGTWDGTGWELGDYIYLRSEEAYFIAMECLAHQNDVSNAKTMLVNFMKTRQPDYTCTAQTVADVIEEINYQKRVEFWGEGIEYLDNRRLNIPVDRTDATWGADNNHAPAAKLTWGAEEIGLTYQLPISEIENNTKLTSADQNQ